MSGGDVRREIRCHHGATPELGPTVSNNSLHAFFLALVTSHDRGKLFIYLELFTIPTNPDLNPTDCHIPPGNFRIPGFMSDLHR
jgi:hypothetical protein